jgi:quercetin dioxygenase-like cupin family protein
MRYLMILLAHVLGPIVLPHAIVRVEEVTYGPGERSPAHHHDCPVIAYVLSGAYRSRVADQPESTYTAGQMFSEPKGAEHQISANASKTQPTTFLAIFICEKPR